MSTTTNISDMPLAIEALENVNLSVPSVIDEVSWVAQPQHYVVDALMYRLLLSFESLTNQIESVGGAGTAAQVFKMFFVRVIRRNVLLGTKMDEPGFEAKFMIRKEDSVYYESSTFEFRNPLPSSSTPAHITRIASLFLFFRAIVVQDVLNWALGRIGYRDPAPIEYERIYMLSSWLPETPLMSILTVAPTGRPTVKSLISLMQSRQDLCLVMGDVLRLQKRKLGGTVLSNMSRMTRYISKWQSMFNVVKTQMGGSDSSSADTEQATPKPFVVTPDGIVTTATSPTFGLEQIAPFLEGVFPVLDDGVPLLRRPLSPLVIPPPTPTFTVTEGMQTAPSSPSRSEVQSIYSLHSIVSEPPTLASPEMETLKQNILFRYSVSESHLFIPLDSPEHRGVHSWDYPILLIDDSISLVVHRIAVPYLAELIGEHAVPGSFVSTASTTWSSDRVLSIMGDMDSRIQVREEDGDIKFQVTEPVRDPSPPVVEPVPDTSWTKGPAEAIHRLGNFFKLATSSPSELRAHLDEASPALGFMNKLASAWTKVSDFFVWIFSAGTAFLKLAGATLVALVLKYTDQLSANFKKIFSFVVKWWSGFEDLPFAKWLRGWFTSEKESENPNDNSNETLVETQMAAKSTALLLSSYFATCGLETPNVKTLTSLPKTVKSFNDLVDLLMGVLVDLLGDATPRWILKFTGDTYVDLGEWQHDVLDLLTDESVQKLVLTRSLPIRIKMLIDKGNSLLRAGRGSKNDSLNGYINNLLAQLTKMLTRVEPLVTTASFTRACPDVTMLFGSSGVGKSNVLHTLAKCAAFQSSMDDPLRKEIYLSNARSEIFNKSSDKFDDGMTSYQSVYLHDDFDQVKPYTGAETSPGREIIHLANNAAYNPWMAALEQKNNVFASFDYMILSTNSEEIKDPTIVCPQAFARRIDNLLKVTRKPGAMNYDIDAWDFEVYTIPEGANDVLVFKPTGVMLSIHDVFMRMLASHQRKVDYFESSKIDVEVLHSSIVNGPKFCDRPMSPNRKKYIEKLKNDYLTDKLSYDQVVENWKAFSDDPCPIREILWAEMDHDPIPVTTQMGLFTSSEKISRRIDHIVASYEKDWGPYGVPLNYRQAWDMATENMIPKISFEVYMRENHILERHITPGSFRYLLEALPPEAIDYKALVPDFYLPPVQGVDESNEDYAQRCDSDEQQHLEALKRSKTMREKLSSWWTDKVLPTVVSPLYRSILWIRDYLSKTKTTLLVFGSIVGLIVASGLAMLIKYFISEDIFTQTWATPPHLWNKLRGSKKGSRDPKNKGQSSARKSARLVKSHWDNQCGPVTGPSVDWTTFQDIKDWSRKVREDVAKYLRGRGVLPNEFETQGNVTDTEAVIRENMCKVFYSYDGKLFDQAGFATGVKDRVIMMPLHFITTILANAEEEGLNWLDVKLRLVRGERIFEYTLREVKPMGMDDTCENDVSFWEIQDKTFPMFRSIVHLFVQPDDVFSAMFSAARSFSGGLVFPDRVVNFSKGWGLASAYMADTEDTRTNLLAYPCDSERGWCGAPLILTNSRYRGRIVGIHIAGAAGRNGMSSLVSQLNVLTALGENKAPVPVEEEIEDIRCQTSVKNPRDFHGEVEANYLTRELNPPASTHIRNTIVRWKGEGPIYTEVKTCPTDVSPKKYEENRAKLPVVKAKKFTDPEVLRSVLTTHYRSFAPDVIMRRLTLHESIVGPEGYESGGVDFRTSTGYPDTENGVTGKDYWQISPTGSLVRGVKWSQLVDLLSDTVSLLKDGHVPAIAFKDVEKGERLPMAKVKSGKVRLINVPPKHIAVLFKMYFGAAIEVVARGTPFNTILKGHDEKNSSYWTTVVAYLKSVGDGKYVGSGDYSGFDNHQSGYTVAFAMSVLAAMYDPNDGDATIRRTLIKLVVEHYHVFGSVLELRFCGMPSGVSLTSEINSVTNLAFMLEAWRRVNSSCACYLSFFEHVKPLILGDDHVFSVSREYRNIFTPALLAKVVADYGHVYTGADKGPPAKDLTPLENHTILKRSFRYDAALREWVGPLDLDVILELPFWSRSGGDYEKIAMDNQDTALRELSLHGKGVFEEWLPKMKAFQGRYWKPFTESWRVAYDATRKA